MTIGGVLSIPKSSCIIFLLSAASYNDYRRSSIDSIHLIQIVVCRRSQWHYIDVSQYHHVHVWGGNITSKHIRSQVNYIRKLVNYIQSQVNYIGSQANYIRSPVNYIRSPVNYIRSQVNNIRKLVKHIQIQVQNMYIRNLVKPQV